MSSETIEVKLIGNPWTGSTGMRTMIRDIQMQFDSEQNFDQQSCIWQTF